MYQCVPSALGDVVNTIIASVPVCCFVIKKSPKKVKKKASIPLKRTKFKYM